MFTGIVEELGKVQSILRNSSSLTICINCSFARELALGESVAVNGTCLTVTEKTQNSFCADVTPETFRRTSLGELSNGGIVNLERAMKVDGRFGGHIVSGHIDGTGRFLSFEKEENAVNIKIAVNEKIGFYIIEKGSVCVDGISLTVANILKTGGEYIFSVAVIPHTWKNTNLSKKSFGSLVNIECDVIGKYVEHFLSFSSGGKICGNFFGETRNDKTELGESENFADDFENLDEATQSFMTNFPSFH